MQSQWPSGFTSSSKQYCSHRVIRSTRSPHCLSLQKLLNFITRKPWPSRFHDVGKCLSSQKLKDLVWGSSSYAIRKNLFLSSFKFVTHLFCRPGLLNTTMFCKVFHARVDEWQNQTTSHVLVTLSLFDNIGLSLMKLYPVHPHAGRSLYSSSCTSVWHSEWKSEQVYIPSPISGSDSWLLLRTRPLVWFHLTWTDTWFPLLQNATVKNSIENKADTWRYAISKWILVSCYQYSIIDSKKRFYYWLQNANSSIDWKTHIQLYLQNFHNWLQNTIKRDSWSKVDN